MLAAANFESETTAEETFDENLFIEFATLQLQRLII